MPKKLLLSIVFSIPMFLFSQNKEAQASINIFNKQLEAAKKQMAEGNTDVLPYRINQLEKLITTIKQKDNAYNTSGLEKQIQPLKDFVNQNSKKDTAQLSNKAKTGQNQSSNHVLHANAGKSKWDESVAKGVLDFLFINNNLQVGHNNLEFAPKRVADYIRMKDSALRYEKKWPELYVKYIQKYSGYMDTFFARNARLLKDINNSDQYMPAFYELKLQAAYWQAASEIYPDQTAFSTMYNRVLDYQKKVGGTDEIAKMAKENSAEKLKNQRMPAAKSTNAEIEKYIRDNFISKYGATYNGISVLKIVLTHSTWHIEKHPVTGVPLSRNYGASVAFKGKDGKCYYLSGVVAVYEDYDGQGYVNRRLVYTGLGEVEILCENINK